MPSLLGIFYLVSSVSSWLSFQHFRLVSYLSMLYFDKILSFNTDVQIAGDHYVRGISITPGRNVFQEMSMALNPHTVMISPPSQTTTAVAVLSITTIYLFTK